MFSLRQKHNKPWINPLLEKIESKLSRFSYSRDDMEFLKQYVVTDEQLRAVVDEREKKKKQELAARIVETLKESSYNSKPTADSDAAQFAGDNTAALIICLAQTPFSPQRLHPALSDLKSEMEQFADLLFDSFRAASSLLVVHNIISYWFCGSVDGSIRLFCKDNNDKTYEYRYVLPVSEESDAFWLSVSKFYALRALDDCDSETMHDWLSVHNYVKSRQT